MEILTEKWTLVIAGQWNVHIFSPDWVGQHVFESKQILVEVSMISSDCHVRYRKDNLLIIPEDDRIIIGLNSHENVTLRQAEQIAQRIVNELPHTPMTGMGINFGYMENNPPDRLAALFDLNDKVQLAENGDKVITTVVKRTLELDIGVLNLDISSSGGIYNIDLNFHTDINQTTDLRTLFEDKVSLYMKRGSDILKSIYDLELEEESN